jgi:hypothetical protein
VPTHTTSLCVLDLGANDKVARADLRATELLVSPAAESRDIPARNPFPVEAARDPGAWNAVHKLAARLAG